MTEGEHDTGGANSGSATPYYRNMPKQTHTRDRHLPRLSGSSGTPSACQEDACWRCGADPGTRRRIGDDPEANRRRTGATALADERSARMILPSPCSSLFIRRLRAHEEEQAIKQAVGDHCDVIVCLCLRAQTRPSFPLTTAPAFFVHERGHHGSELAGTFGTTARTRCPVLA